MKVEIRNLKTLKEASDETLCFSATIYIEGVNAGTVHNEGHGGENTYSNRTTREILEEYAKTLPPLPSPFADSPEPIPMDADLVIDEVIREIEMRKDLRKKLRERLVFVKGHECSITKRLTKEQMEKVLADPVALQKRHEGQMILNLMTEDEAFIHFKECT